MIRRSHRAAIVIGLAVALSALWISLIYWIEFERRETHVQSQHELRQLTVAVHEQTLRLFKDVESSLKTVDFWVDTHPGPMEGNADLESLLRLIRETSDGLVNVRLVGPDGNVLFGSGTPSAPGMFPLNVADREYFKVQLDPKTRGLYIGTPIESRVLHEIVIPISYPVTRPRDDVVIISAAIAVERLIPVYEQIRFKPAGAIDLMRTDGIIVARAPDAARYSGVSIVGKPDFDEQIATARRGVYDSPLSALDGEPRMVSFSRIDQYPLVVIVSETLEDIFEGWNGHRTLLLWGGAFMSLLLVLAGSGILFMLYLLQKSEHVLQREAMYDGMTGSLNRHAFDEAAHREFTRAERYERPLSVATIDLDHFKTINDTYGHATGDAVLKHLARLWEQSVRSTDLLGRVGGEEFAVLMPDTDQVSAVSIAERLMAETRMASIPTSSGPLRVTVSIGVATAMPFDYRFGDLLERADAALYQAKRDGRDRIQMG